MTLALTRLGCQKVAHEGSFHLEFARARLPEPLGGAAFRFELWHDLLTGKRTLSFPMQGK
jgi:hypothetical protein